MNNMNFSVSLPKNPAISIKVIPGHFATASSHVSHYLDMSELKTNASVAKDVAKELAMPYLTRDIVDVIVSMDGTGVIGAYLAEELVQGGISVMNSGREIHIVTPIYGANRKLIFQNNVREIISGKRVILLVASASSGRTIEGALECIEYYGGKLAGISALFNALPRDYKPEIFTVFTSDEIPEYKFFSSSKCALCESGRKLDAIINSEGYTSI